MSEPGAAPESRAGYMGQPDQRPWPDGPSTPSASFTPLLRETQPRLATPPPHPRAAAPMNRPQDAVGLAEDDLSDTSKRKRVTDSVRMPALRLNRRSRGPRAGQPRRAKVYDMARAPGYLRLARLAMGLALLAAAWGVTLVVISLGQALWLVTPSQPVLTDRLALYLLEAIGILWLAVVAVGLVVVGAFSVFLALTKRGW